MACGIPLVATDVPGISDVLAHGERSGGLIVPVDNPVALADALGKLPDDEALCRELGVRARRRAEQGFSLQTVGMRLREFLFDSRES